MRHTVKRLALGVLGGILYSAAASATVDLSGRYNVTVAGLQFGTAIFDFIQADTQLTLTFTIVDPPFGAYAPANGAIDPDTGSFFIPLPDTPPVLIFPACTGNRIEGTASPDGQIIEGRMVVHEHGGLGNCVDVGGLFIGVRSTCRDGVLDLGEQCDDGNSVSGDCCSPFCQFEPSGAACSDGNTCTDDTCDGAGICQAANNSAACGTTCAPATCSGGSCAPVDPAVPGTPCDDGDICTNADACDGAGACAGPPVICDVCETCVAPGGCVGGPVLACSAMSGKGAVRLDLSRPALALTSKESAGLDFGDPVASTDYEVCIFSHDGVAWSQLVAARAPSGGTCGGAPCWKATGTGFAYRNPGATPGGLTALRLRETGRVTGATLRGLGTALQAPAELPALVESLRVELRGVDPQGGVCYATDFTSLAVHPPFRLRGRR